MDNQQQIGSKSGQSTDIPSPQQPPYQVIKEEIQSANNTLTMQSTGPGIGSDSNVGDSDPMNTSMKSQSQGPDASVIHYGSQSGAVAVSTDPHTSLSSGTQPTSSSSSGGGANNNTSPRPRQPWHDDPKVLGERESVKSSIVELLTQKRASTSEWQEKLPLMAARLDDALFYHAKSLHEYTDASTLKLRLQNLAMLMNQSKNRTSNGSSNGGIKIEPGGASSNRGGLLIKNEPNADGSSNRIPVITGPPGSQSAASESDHRKQVLKQQQQRLLLLRHASKCPHEKCPVTPHCANMKALWKHIMSCKDQDCKAGHCVSSRYVLAHYSQCKDSACPVCGPVREAIRRNYERSKDVMKMANAGNLNGIQDGSGYRRDNEPKAKKPRVNKNQMHGSMSHPGDHHPLIISIPNKPKIQKLLDPVSCAMYLFSQGQISEHFKSIHEGMKNSNMRIREICLPPLDEILKTPNALNIFGWPVDHITMGLPDYPEIVKYPMDLGTVKKRIEQSFYRDTQHFVSDTNLVFDNAMLYNSRGTYVHDFAKNLKKIFVARFKVSMQSYEKKLYEARRNENACLFCGEMCLKFEPPVYYCNGRCGGQRIRRNAFFYTGGNNAYHWCSTCFGDLKDDQAIRLLDCTLSKAEIARSKKKHQEEVEEPWVQCNDCNRWAHILCSLFNNRRNLGDDVEYVCPFCLIKRKEIKNDIMVPSTKKTRAEDLPHSVLSQFLETKIAWRLEKAYKEVSDKTGVPVENVERCNNLIIRVVASYDKDQHVREGVYERYKPKGYPEAYPCRVKCIVLFQNIDGQNVIIFGMYVYEYGHKCPDPNQRRCYISYLDSVHYFRPRQYRTIVYHEIMVSYLDYMKRRGFHTVHIWACPPLKGDDYILHIHPQDQKTPKDDKLRKWYVDILQICKERGIVVEVSDLYTEYLSDPTLDATVLPYFEGDYWCNEAEVILKNLQGDKNNLAAAASIASLKSEEDGEHDGDDSLGQKSKRKNKRKGLGGRTTTRSVAAVTGGVGVGGVDRDPIMAKLATIIEPMKEAFFVARLHPREYAEEKKIQRQKEIEEEKLSNELIKDNLTDTQRQQQLQEEALNDTSAAPTVLHVQKESKEDEKAEEEEEEDEKDTTKSQEEEEEEEDDNDFAASAAAISTNLDGSSSGPAPVDFSAATANMNADDDNDMSLSRNPPLEKSNSLGNFKDLHSDSDGSGNAPGRDVADLSRGADVVNPADYASSDISMEAGSKGVINSSTTDLSNGGVSSKVRTKELAKAGPPAAKGRGRPRGRPAGSSQAAQVAAAAAGGGGGSLGITDGDDLNTSSDSKNGPNKVGGVKSPASKSSAAEAIAIPTNPIDDEKARVRAAELAEQNRIYDLELAKKFSVDDLLKDVKDDTEDIDDTLESAHFDTRQSFLNLCQGNHYQFDQLRRVKHTSMMVLYHMHNPDAPKFVPQCNVCIKDILSSHGVHCPSCDIHFCGDCFKIHGGPRIHPQHQLKQMVENNQPKQLTEEQRRDRQRSLLVHLQLLMHSVNCDSKECVSRNCIKMKEFIKHEMECKIKVQKGCPQCKRMYNLLQMHAKACRLEVCKVPNCGAIREHIKQMEMRQQLMDDRRRAMMNQMYNQTGNSSAAVEPDE